MLQMTDAVCCVDEQEQLKEEVLRMAKQVNAAGFNLLCIDTENQFVTTGFGKEIAQVTSHAD
jgi:magnesium chelatase subunit D